MRAIVVHHSLSEFGGAELVAVAVIETLHEMGFEIELVTVEKPKNEMLRRIFDAKLDVKSIHCVLPSNLRLHKSQYSQLITQLLTLPLMLGKKADLIINTHADFPLPYLKRHTPLISYVHFPYIPHFSSVRQYPQRYQKSIVWKIYYTPYNILAGLLKPLVMFALKRSYVLTNSYYSKNEINREAPTVNPLIVRPPVDTEHFTNFESSQHRENKILVIGRIAPEKQLERAIEIGKFLPTNSKMYIIGRFKPSVRANNYLDKLESMINQYGLNNRIEILKNVSRDELREQMLSAKVYLHTKSDEHFGISIVEAVSAGLVPIVPASGGPKEFIPQCYHYRTNEEAAELITKYLDISQNERLTISKIANKFSKSEFKNKLKKIIDSILQSSC